MFNFKVEESRRFPRVSKAEPAEAPALAPGPRWPERLRALAKQDASTLESLRMHRRLKPDALKQNSDPVRQHVVRQVAEGTTPSPP
jgi:hypothetical protein